MSDLSRRPNDETPRQAGRGKRLEKKAAPAQTPAQAQKKRERTIMVIMILVAVVMVLAAVVVLIWNRWFKEPDLPSHGGPKQSSAPDSSDPPGGESEEPFEMDTLEPKVGGGRKSDKIFTILIFGSDTTSGLTDSMMVATYDVTNQKAAVMSLPRDTLINSSARPNISAKKLNAVYNVYGKGDAGIEALKNEVAELVGFVPDYYVQIDWELVGDMVDAIGGVWFDNPYHMEYYDPYQDLNIYQEQGYRKLNGADAMQVVRWRHNNPGVPYNPGVSKATAVGDIERLEVQHSFLKAVLKQTLQIQTLFKINELIELFNSRVNSDLELREMSWFAREAVVGGLQVDDVEFCTMPTILGSYYQFGQDWSFVYPNQGQLLDIINKSLNPFQEDVTLRQLDLMGVNTDGSLYSTTGRLAAPELGEIPVRETPEPEESDGPAESGPLESGEPSESGPVESGPVESGPVPAETDGLPLEGQPGEGGAQGDEGPAPSAAEPAAGADGTVDWGGTPE